MQKNTSPTPLSRTDAWRHKRAQESYELELQRRSFHITAVVIGATVLSAATVAVALVGTSAMAAGFVGGVSGVILCHGGLAAHAHRNAKQFRALAESFG